MPKTKKTIPSQNRKPLFVVVIPRFEDMANSFYSGEVSRGVSIAASRLDVDVLIHMVNRDDHSHWLDGLLDPYFVDGLLFADIDRDWEIVKKAIRQGMPTMVLNNLHTGPFNTIAIDNLSAARRAVEYLHDLGHKKIGTVAGDLNTQAGQDRLTGFKDGLEAVGLKMDSKWAKQGGFLRTPARKAAKTILKDEKHCPTAIFAASDVMAHEVADVAKELGIKVPEQLSIVGFDNNLDEGELGIRLTTFDQPIVDMARLGIESLYQISLGLAKLPVKILLEAKLVKRRSTSSIKK